MRLPLRRCAPSPSLAAREGDDTLGAGRRGRLRPFLGVPGVGRDSFIRRACIWRHAVGIWPVRNAESWGNLQ
ncbi:hypothetical protein CTI10_029910 [Delftia acidovorans]|nr:hypothetical protein CTI10_029910 [Delftia acidovorans]